MTGALSLLLAVGGLLLLTATVYAQPSGSDGTVPSNLSGPCEVTATISETGTAIDPSVSGGVYTVPIAGSASYSGSINVPPENRAHDGRVWVVTPPGIPSVTIRQWADPDTDTVSDAGSVSWELPGETPRGVAITVQGYHNDTGGTCTGSIVVKLEGGPLDSALGVASVALTFVAAGGLIFAAIPAGR